MRYNQQPRSKTAIKFKTLSEELSMQIYCSTLASLHELSKTE